VNQYEAVSFGDSLFGCYVLLPLQQEHSVTLREAVWGEHITVLRSLSIPISEVLSDLSIPISEVLSDLSISISEVLSDLYIRPLSIWEQVAGW